MKAGAQSTLRSTQSAPRNIPDLRPGERILLLVRRHPVVLFTGLLWPLLALAVWVGSLFFMPGVMAGLQPKEFALPGEPGPPGWLAPVVMFCWLALCLPILTWAAYIVFDWLDHWLALTTRRVIIMDKVLFLRESRREAPVLKIQNVTAEFPHPLGTALDFGNVQIDTSGVGVLSFNGVSHPRALREAVFAQQSAWRAAQPPPESYRRAAIRGILEGRDPASYLPPGVAARMRRQRAGAEPPPLVVWRKHPFFLVLGVAWPLLVYVGLLALWGISGLVTGQGLTGPLSGNLGWAVALFTPVCLAWILWSWEDWRNDLYKLDHERVCHIESLPLGLREQSKETLITRITDVTYTVPGLLANLLDYGDVVIKTPGESTEFVFRRIPNPRQVQAEIMARLDEYRLKDHAGMDREIEGWLKAYHEVMRET